MIGTVFVKNFKLQARVGCDHKERSQHQELLVNLSVSVDMTQAIDTDDLAHTVDYVSIMHAAEDLVKEHDYALIETLADALATLCLANPYAKSVSVKIEKPRKFNTSDSVGIEIEKSK